MQFAELHSGFDVSLSSTCTSHRLQRSSDMKMRLACLLLSVSATGIAEALSYRYALYRIEQSGQRP